MLMLLKIALILLYIFAHICGLSGNNQILVVINIKAIAEYYPKYYVWQEPGARGPYYLTNIFIVN